MKQISAGNPPRPIPLVVLHHNIPADLTKLTQWVLWTYTFVDGKWTKPLFQVDGWGHAKTNDPSTWDTVDAALKSYQRGGVDGIGIVLTVKMGIVGVDLDHCRDTETKEIEPWVMAIIKHFNSYT